MKRSPSHTYQLGIRCLILVPTYIELIINSFLKLELSHTKQLVKPFSNKQRLANPIFFSQEVLITSDRSKYFASSSKFSVDGDVAIRSLLCIRRLSRNSKKILRLTRKKKRKDRERKGSQVRVTFIIYYTSISYIIYKYLYKHHIQHIALYRSREILRETHLQTAIFFLFFPFLRAFSLVQGLQTGTTLEVDNRDLRAEAYCNIANSKYI